MKKIIERRRDLLTCCAGEEFIIALPNTRDATSVAYLYNQAVRDLKIPHEFSEAAAITTVSAGVGLETCIPDSSADLSMIIENADKALYAAKVLNQKALPLPQLSRSPVTISVNVIQIEQQNVTKIHNAQQFKKSLN